ncbi:hypothetical protein CXB51_033864 [Gossypium anomalum]|uniref:Uncharacterized protein n=1 Tax=Gossypium anomalum TaxID=47600 RepID=A0A8J6CN85_9ROSI|nr:hypothetical protein CXB51_033864 [Gossypium anomalum]
MSKVIDISSYLLFEATGDSESGCCFDPAMSVINHDDDDGGGGGGGGGGGDDDDDDAESCSCDTTTSDVVHGVREANRFEQKANDDDDNDDDDDDDDDGEVVEMRKEVRLHKKCRDDRRFNGGAAKDKKSSTVDSTKTPKEKNRLFWEACLAS